MYAGVPCYNLRKLRRAIAFDLPAAKGALGAFRELRATWKRQQIEPGYQYDTPLPATANPGQLNGRRAQPADDLGDSIGDLAPPVLARA